jgi:hypothetical protein
MVYAPIAEADESKEESQLGSPRQSPENLKMDKSQQ